MDVDVDLENFGGFCVGMVGKLFQNALRIRVRILFAFLGEERWLDLTQVWGLG